MTEIFRDLQSFYKTTITGRISASASTIPVAIPPTVTSGFLVIEPETVNQEIILYTGVTGNNLTGAVRDLASSGSSESAGTGKPHGAGSEIAMMDVHYYIKLIQSKSTWKYRGSFLNTTAIDAITNAETGDIAVEYTNKFIYIYDGADWVPMDTSGVVHTTGDESILGVKTFTDIAKYASHPTFTSETDIIDKKYADDLTFAGAPDASTTQKGIVEIATQAQVDAGTDIGETGAKLAVIPSTLSYTQQLQENALTAGEDLVVGDSLMIADGTESRLINEQSLVSNVGNRVFGTTWAYQSFTTGSTTTSIKRIRLTGYIATNTVTIYLRATPTGANIATGSQSLEGGNIDITLSSNTVTPNTLYYIIITVGGVNSGFTNDIYGSATSSYSRGTPGYSTDSGVTWGTPPNVTGDFYFKVYEINTIAGRVYKTRTDTDNITGTSWYNNFIGFSKAITSMGSLATIQPGNVAKMLSSLTPSSTYYLSNTPGAISSSAGTVSKKVGLALSATELLIKHDN